MKEIAIAGFAPRSKARVQEAAEDVEIWTLNHAWKHGMPRIDRLFELHQPAALRINEPDSQRHYAWLRLPQSFPVYTLPVANPDFPAAVAYPFEAVCAEFGDALSWGGQPLRVFTSTFDYMLALAIYEGVECIHVSGVEMSSETEYGYQRPGMAFWMGIAAARGVEVRLPRESQLFRPRLYHEGGQMLSRQRVESHKEGHAHAQAQMLAAYHAALGRFDVVRQMRMDEQASDQDVTRARQAVLDAKAALDIVSGALQALELLLRDFDELGVELELASPIEVGADGMGR